MTRYIFTLYALLATTCCSSKTDNLQNQPSPSNTNYTRIIAAIKADGYEIKPRRFKRLSFLKCAKPIKNTGLYEMQYICHDVIIAAKIHQKKNQSANKPVND